MRLLLDSHVLIAIALRRLDATYPEIARHIAGAPGNLFASVASLWEIAIKTRLGKLDPGMRPEDLPSFFEAGGIKIITITAAHSVVLVEPLPLTRDPFDRMLLAQCHVEDCRLVTIDRALFDHPLTARLAAPVRGKPTGRNPRTHR